MKVAHFRVESDRGATDIEAGYDLARYLICCEIDLEDFSLICRAGMLILRFENDRIETAVKALIDWHNRVTQSGNTFRSRDTTSIPGFPYVSTLSLTKRRFAIVQSSMPVDIEPVNSIV